MHEWEWREIDLTDVKFSELESRLAALRCSGWEVVSMGTEDSAGRLVVKLRRPRMPRQSRPLAG